MTDEGYSEFQLRVRAVVAGIAPGEVMTYGEVAEEAGFPGGARAVGNTMRRHSDGLPWWRVVGANGVIVGSRPDVAIERLRAEGITVVEGVITAMSATLKKAT